MHIRRFALGLLLLAAGAACDESPVSLPEASGVTVGAASMALLVGDVAPVAAQVVDQDGRVMQGPVVVFSTDNASVATVGADGMVRAVAPGTANVTAAHGGSIAKVAVTVTAASMTVVVPGAGMGLVVGDAAPIAAQVLDRNGAVVQGAALVFSTNNAQVATVGNDGMVRGLAPGTANITAAYGGSTATVAVTVFPNGRGELQTLDVLADSVVTDWRAGVQVVAVRAVNGFGQAVCPEITLRSSDRAVATARMAGQCRIEVVPSFTGEAVITAEAEGRTDTFRVRITSSAQIAFISSRPSSAQLVAGATVSYTVKVLDQVSRPIANQRVSFETSVGTLSANSVVTGEDGTATVQWQIPADLRSLGQNHWFAFRALLPNGVLAWRDETVFINGASIAEIVLYGAPGWRNTGGLQRVEPPVVQANSSGEATLGVSGLDQYGNVRMDDYTFSITGGNAQFDFACSSEGQQLSSGIEFTCIHRTGPGSTATVRATAAGQHRSVQVVFTND